MDSWRASLDVKEFAEVKDRVTQLNQGLPPCLILGKPAGLVDLNLVVQLLSAEAGFQRIRTSRQREAEGELHSVIPNAVRLASNPLGKMLGLLGEESVIEHGEGLERHGGRIASRTVDRHERLVENTREREVVGPAGKQVDAALPAQSGP